ncbi:DUF6233 domain-containing protein [Streptomyces sp. NPDC126499]|uniref:DUF6233 domain-containing protein n=1 Tax=Streptomyces sp. NPDC126499 TaxID=3155314 RepID=UPI003321683B
MYDLPPDLPRLRTLETYLAMLLGDVRDRIRKAEQQQAAAVSARTLPAGPGFVLSFLRKGGQAHADSVHLDDCTMASRHTRPLDRDQALQAITTGGIRACEICRPDSELGVLE